MKILLIGINFGDYENKIRNELVEQGHEVFYMADTSKNYTAYNRLLGKSFTNYVNNRYQIKRVKQMPNGFERVIVIVGRCLTNEFLDTLRRNNPQALFSLYLWDDVKRVENFQEVKHFYDEIYSFDLKDCRDYGFKHLPLFYTKIPNEYIEKKYDIYSAMFRHSERERIIHEIDKQARMYCLKTKFIVCLGKYEYFQRLCRCKCLNKMNTVYVASPIDVEVNYNNMNEAKIVLDVQFTGQIGLTMRTIESLGMCNKIITTNPSIVYYDFYTDENVLLIDRDKPELKEEFVKCDYKTIDRNIYEKYSLQTWIKTLTGEVMLNNYIGNYKLEDLNFEG